MIVSTSSRIDGGRIFNVKLDSKWTGVLIIVTAVLALLCVVGVAAAGWAVTRPQSTPEPTDVPVRFEYCGERLKDLCVVSFGRDVFGNTVINLYVPQQTYPPFYMKVIRASDESLYECDANEDVVTSVYCVGAPLNLGDGFELQLLTELGDELLAQGTFTLTAFRVTTPIPEPTATGSNSAPQKAPTSRASPTPTASATPSDLDTNLPTSTPTPESSYTYP